MVHNMILLYHQTVLNILSLEQEGPDIVPYAPGQLEVGLWVSTICWTMTERTRLLFLSLF